MPLVVLKKVFNATLDPTFRVAPSSSSPGMTVCVGSDSGFHPFIQEATDTPPATLFLLPDRTLARDVSIFEVCIQTVFLAELEGVVNSF